MTNDEITKQLESLLSHCKGMIEKDGGFPIWEKDCEALEAAIVALRPSGEPLTLEQLRKMDGKPVWLKIAGGVWGIVDCFNDCVVTSLAKDIRLNALAGLAYAYPPIGREKWEPCEWCGSVGKTPDNWVCTLEDENGHTVTNQHIVVCATANYCPVCGRPLTEAAEARAEKAERERDTAVSDLETIMAYKSLDTCQFCKNSQCHIRGGTKPCLPKWRGIKEE